MSKQIKKTQKFAMYALSIMLGAISSWFVFSKEQREHYTVVDGSDIAHRFMPTARADTGASDAADAADAADGECKVCGNYDSDSGPDSPDGDFGCFVAGTPILMADGSTKPIEQVAVGDEVMAFDGMGALVPQKVLKLLKHEPQPVLSVNGTLVTSVHRFLLPDGQYKAIGDIDPAEPLVAADGSLVEHWTVEAVEGDREVFNFTVDNMHTYVAGDFRVHNIK